MTGHANKPISVLSLRNNSNVKDLNFHLLKVVLLKLTSEKGSATAEPPYRK